MENDGLRRSCRTRAAVKTFQAGQEQAALVAPVRKKTTKVKVESESGVDVSIKDEPNAEVTRPESLAVDPQNVDDEAEEESKPSEKRSHATDLDDFKEEDDSDLDTRAKRKRKQRLKKSATAPSQLYGHPPTGTVIPWGTRWRKQPQIYEVKAGNGASKSTDWMQTVAENRVREELESIEKLAPGQEEARLERFIDKPSVEYQGYLDRANTHKMFILGRLRSVEHDCHANLTDCPYENLQIAGSKGSVYSVRISHLTTCTCPSATGLFVRRGGERPQCKHIIYVLHHVLKAPKHLEYQKAFLSSELKELFAAAPPLPAQVAQAEVQDGNRKPVEGDCPVCFTEFGDESVTWCRSSCGNNIHTECLKEWAKAKTAVVSCPFCRADWQFDDEKQILAIDVEMPTAAGQGGYLNVYDQLQYK